MTAGGSVPEWKTSQLIELIWPLVIDQLLITLIGIVDTAMVASLGENAVSGVSLVDSINVLVISLFSSLTTGGSVVCSQFLGRRDPLNASNSAKQLVYFSFLVSGSLGLLTFILRIPVLKLIYGHIEQGVMIEAEQYFFYTSLSYPFIALSAAGAAIFRSMGNSRVGMWISLLINALNFGGNALLMYVLHMGVAGAAISTLFSRLVAALWLIILLVKSRGAINLRGFLRVKIFLPIIRSMLKVAVPNGLEGASFQVGKLALARLVSVFGTAAIAGNAIGNIFMTLGNLPGMAIAQALLVVVGQSVGAGDFDGVKRHTGRLIRFNYAAMITFNGLILLAMPLVFRLFGSSLSPESVAYGRIFGTIFCTAAMVVWIPAYCLPFALRAAGDGAYTLIVSTAAMWTARVGGAYLMAYVFNLGAVSVWIAMVIEWTFRAAGYTARWYSGKWRGKKVI